MPIIDKQERTERIIARRAASMRAEILRRRSHARRERVLNRAVFRYPHCIPEPPVELPQPIETGNAQTSAQPPKE